MKRIFALLILLIFFCGFLFAEVIVNVSVGSVVDAFYSRTFTGDYAVKQSALPGSPYRFQGDGDILLFQGSKFAYPLTARADISYTGEKLGGTLNLLGNVDTEFNDFWKYEAWMRIGPYVKVLTGNIENHGQVEYYQNFESFMRTRIEYLGVFLPAYQITPNFLQDNNLDTIDAFPWGYEGGKTSKGYATFASTNTNDLFSAFSPFAEESPSKMNFMIEGNYEMFTLSAAVGGLFSSLSRPFVIPWVYGQGGRTNDYDSTYDSVLKGNMSFGVRAEAADIMDMVTLSAIYKYSEETLAKRTAEQPVNIIDETVGNHSFGIYANIKPFEGLGITLGYSAFQQTWKNDLPGNIILDNIASLNPEDAERHYLSLYKDVNFPFYSGIDLRASFTGIKRLAITFNNNVSFASLDGIDTPGEGSTYVKSWAYFETLNALNASNRSESYLGLYNALGIKFDITDDLAAHLQVGNQLGIFTLSWENDDIVSITNNLGLYAGASYSVWEGEKIHAIIWGGVALRLASYSWQEPTTNNIHKTGVMEFGIPIRLRVEY